MLLRGTTTPFIMVYVNRNASTNLTQSIKFNQSVRNVTETLHVKFGKVFPPEI